MKLEEAIKYLFDGKCMLFAGSGASLGASNISQNQVKSVAELTNLLFEKCNIEGNNSLTDASDIFVEQFGEFKLIDLLKEEFTISDVTDSQRILGSIPWKRIYTTNYDNVLELSASKSQRKLTPVTLSDSPSDFKDKSKLCIHLNGFVDKLTPNTLRNEFKLTDTSYLTTEFINSGWISNFKNDLIVCDAIFFVGFSLKSDLDLKRVISATPQLKDKCFFIVWEKESEINLRTLSKFGTPCPIGLTKFADSVNEIFTAEKIQQIKLNHENTKTKEKLFCFNTFNLSDSPKKVKDFDFYKLLDEGYYDTSLIQSSILDSSANYYYLDREVSTTALNAIHEKKLDLLILSDLGNGKSLLKEGLKVILKNLGYSVFEFIKYFDTLDSEIEAICTANEKSIVFIEGYSQHLELINKLSLMRSDLRLVLTERNLINDIYESKLAQQLDNKFQPIMLDRLTDIDIENLAELFDKYGYFGKLASASNERKLQHLKIDCRRNFREILIDRIKSKNILGKFQKILEELKVQKYFIDAVTLILASNLFEFPLDLDDIGYIFDELIDEREFTRNRGIKEFIDFGTMEIYVRSSILSEAILLNLMSPSGIVDTMIKVCKKLNSRRDDKNVKVILRKIISFSNMQKILRKDSSNEYKYSILNFFEEIKELEFCNRNPHFWLQYAIARLSERDYKIADQYFETAYAFAKNNPTFDTYMIDNHYARHLLESEIIDGDKASCMTQFVKAHRILSNPIDKNKTIHYPFRVAQKYFPFYDRFYKELPDNDKRYFLRSCDEILSRIDSYIENVDPNRIHYDVREAKRVLQRIIDNESSS